MPGLKQPAQKQAVIIVVIRSQQHREQFDPAPIDPAVTAAADRGEQLEADLRVARNAVRQIRADLQQMGRWPQALIGWPARPGCRVVGNDIEAELPGRAGVIGVHLEFVRQCKSWRGE